MGLLQLLLKNPSEDFKCVVGIHLNGIVLLAVVGNQDRLLMDRTIMVAVFIQELLVGVLLTIDLNIGIAVIDEDADFAFLQGIALFNPHGLAIMELRLHKIGRAHV